MAIVQAVKFFPLLPILVLSFFSLSFPSVSFADGCQCFCSIEGQGATRVPDQTTLLSSQDCRKACEENDDRVAVCAFSSEELPTQNPMCFTQAQCANQKGTFDNKSQPGECLNGMHYCYPDPKKIKETDLQVPINGLLRTGDLSKYITVLYQWMLGIGVFIAIVLIMVAGLQHAFAAGRGESASAKKRIRDAVAGVVLLLFTYLVLYTVNPYLVRLQVPKFPMIRQVQLVADGESCGYLTGVWGVEPYLTKNGAPFDSPYAKGQPAPKGGAPYTIADPTRGMQCGSVAQVEKDWEGNDVLEGTTCTFDYCPEKNGEQTWCVGTGDEAACVACAGVIPGGAIPPSSQVCGQIVQKDEYDGKGQLVTDHYCFFTHEADVSVNGWTLTQAFGASVAAVFAGAVSPYASAATATEALGLTGEAADQYLTGTCAQMEIDCTKIDSCRDYDSQKVFNSYEESCLDNIDPIDLAGIGLGGDLNLEGVCSDDPCGVAPPGEICQFFYDSNPSFLGELVPQYFDDSFNCVNSGFKTSLNVSKIFTKDGTFDANYETESCTSYAH